MIPDKVIKMAKDLKADTVYLLVDEGKRQIYGVDYNGGDDPLEYISLGTPVYIAFQNGETEYILDDNAFCYMDMEDTEQRKEVVQIAKNKK